MMTATLHAASRALYLLLAAGALQALVEQLAIAAQAQGAKCASNHAKNKGKAAMKKTVVTEECLKDGLAAVRDPGLVFLLREIGGGRADTGILYTHTHTQIQRRY